MYVPTAPRPALGDFADVEAVRIRPQRVNKMSFRVLMKSDGKGLGLTQNVTHGAMYTVGASRNGNPIGDAKPWRAQGTLPRSTYYALYELVPVPDDAGSRTIVVHGVCRKKELPPPEVPWIGLQGHGDFIRTRYTETP